MTTQAKSASYSAPKPWRKLAALPKTGGMPLLAIVLPSITLVLLLLVWDWAITRFDVPSTVLPRPLDAFEELYFGLMNWTLVNHTLVTMQEVVYGFAIGAFGGFVFGVIVAEWSIARMAIFPFLIAFQMIPKVAIAPLFIIWLGYGISSKVAIAASITFFPVLINTVAGLKAVDGETLEMMRAFRATRWQTFHRVKLKFAMPYIFASLEVAIVLAVIGAIVAEFVGSTQGLGYLILQATFKLETAKIFAVLVMLAILGIFLNALVRWAARRTLFWHDSQRSGRG
ncbi:MAG: ABC transporter permease [Alphaproteobacteria bacterium]